MTFASERAAIETRFNTEWTTGSPAALRTPVGWDAQTFEPPTDESSVRLTILNGDGINQSMGDPGNNAIRYAGVVMIQVFTPGGQGSAAARALVDLIEPIFTNWRSGNILFRTMNVGTPDTSPPFYMVPVSFPYQRDSFLG
ncbi:DUF4128 domain-containing protein [Rhodobium gokarnense]|uniref:Uncharacterized protein n=1 Tax=Rhodobium gokarnense TaxID=364296 RepID=A0ABT3HH81_9HYPH|nr:DUF4128 domain-containing protein [Rhodobium gokarnense]MCW2309725.1 hypothetical protein [Rhodobium gokarnense]